jgi:two-component system, NarL family, captular synthesis response regulator RcsB
MSRLTRNIRVVLADDHPVVHFAVSDTFSGMPGYAIVATANSGAELIRILEREPADLIITDLVMQCDSPVEIDGLRLVSMLRRLFPAVPLVVFTYLTSGNLLYELRKVGVAAIVSKEEPPSELARICIRALVSKETIISPRLESRLAREGLAVKELDREQRLSPRELEVVRLFAQGMSVSEIARNLNRSVPTIATQKRSAMRKLRVENHVDLVKSVNEMGLV